MKMRTSFGTRFRIHFLCISTTALFITASLAYHHHHQGGGEEEEESLIAMATLGGVKESEGFQNSVEIEDLARFAVEEHNKKENKLLEFARVVKAKEQVVAGTLHHLTVEAIDAGTKKLYEAKVWVKPWLNFKELQEFKHAGDSPSLTASDLGVKRDGHEPGWRNVPAHDPVVKDAANHAVTTIQQRSNSIVPYELLDILHAKAEVIEDSAKFDMLLKLKRGSKEEKFKVEVHKNLEGTFHLNQMQQEHVDSV
ncbi:cysteine proteinase inhibitor 12-like [Dioscorea cayenensis subsp. rotundata]|uniref:Cysteine proteinase inhibitor n=1 Tax=Dioscorea cayennensis subsp. rotundata TaxID=55577 RepID=A0AB40CDJ3_DIOCR|nr:cysteine proteinase inhibitor 12-like [Dioscorea cayenensis subsp. rotundata]